ncbi:MAG: restriction endonuclease, partial [Mycobacteriaceae bacterium]
LSDGQVWKKSQVSDSVIKLVGLTEQQCAETLNSGELRVVNRIGWALSALSRAELVSKPARGNFVITEAGRDQLAAHPKGISIRMLKSFPAYNNYFIAERSGNNVKPEDETDDQVDPLEQINTSVRRLHEEVSLELVKRLHELPPAFLERSVIEVLLAMGYGGAEQRGRSIGGSGDEGIDGIIDQDPLGLDQIYVQAKRYGQENPVGRPDIQKFVGALHGKSSIRGVYITTSRFTQEAHDYARTVGTRVILIDGQKLASLMIKYGVGVQTRETFVVVDIDEDYFE